ncbi:FAST kinase domain-containing protein 5, mitochondrial [Pholidichthys leucotaenia]
MATCVLRLRIPLIRNLLGLRKGFAQGQHAGVTQRAETDDQEEKMEVLQQKEACLQTGYRLYYNPSAYNRTVGNSAVSRNQTVYDEDEECRSSHAPSFWQQSNHYSVSCSRYLSSSKNTVLDLAFNKDPEPKAAFVMPHHRKPVPADVKVDPRAFQKCRPEYASVTLDLCERPDPLKWEKVLPLLENVTVLKGNMKPSDVCQFLCELSRLPPEKMLLLRSDQRFIMLLRYSVVNLGLFSDLQLLEVLQSFIWLEMPSTHTVLELYEAELCRRAHQMSLHQLMLAADCWRCIGKQVPQFLQHLFNSLHLYLGQVRISELVQLLYIMGEGRHCPKDLIHPLEQLLMRHLHQLLPEEVGTVCLGLFKSQTSMSEGAVTHTVDKALSFVKEMSDFAMVNVLKYLRFSYLFHRGWLEAMAEEVPQRAHRMGIKGLMHVALTCSALHYSNDSILTAIAERVPSLVPHCRSKDSGKLLWAYGTLGFLPTQSPSFYPSLIDSLRQRKAEFQQYPEHLLTGLLGLAFVSQFPEDLIALALSPDFVNLALKNTQMELKKDLFTLDGTVALELPQWTGPRLSHELREEVAEMLWKIAQSNVCLKPEVQQAEAALQDLLGGEEFVHKRMILPHTRSIDLEINLDPTGRPLPVSPASVEKSSSAFPSDQGWDKLNIGVTITDDLLAQLTTKNTKYSLTRPSKVIPTSCPRLKAEEGGRLYESVLVFSDVTKALSKPSRPDSSHQGSKSTVRVAVQVWNRNHYCSQSQQLLGIHAMKRRQLKMAGYKVVELAYQEWFPILRKSRVEKLSYLHCKIYDSL